MRVVALALLALVGIAGVAEACSMSRSPPGPGAFTVHHAGGATTVPVEGRLLGAMCELSNPHAAEGSLFVWAETPRLVDRATWSLHAVDVATGERHTVERVAEGRVEGMTVVEGRVLLHERTYADGTARSAFYAIDLREGTRERLPFPNGNYVSVAGGGGMLAAVARTDATDTLRVYDGRAGEWVIEGRDARAFGEGQYLWLRGASQNWLALDGPSQRVLLELATGATYPFREGSPFYWLDGDWLYIAEGGQLMRRALPNGTPEPAGAYGGSVLGVHDGMVITGRYSAPELGLLRGLRPETIGGAAAVALILLGGAFWWRRRSG